VEQRTISVIVAGASQRTESPPGASVAATPGPTLEPERLRTLVEALSKSGARVSVIGDSSLVATIAGERETATDQAARAARCALLIKSSWPEAMVALATGRGAADSATPVGDAVDGAWRLLERRRAGDPREDSAVRVDALTSGLLDGRFDLRRGRVGLMLLAGERSNPDPSRPLIGKPTPCVGREFELATLDGSTG
jgi:hypothetical protein